MNHARRAAAIWALVVVVGVVACGRVEAPAVKPTETAKPAAAVATSKPPAPTAVPPADTPLPTAQPTPVPPPVAQKSTAAQRVQVTASGADGVNMRAEPSGSAERVRLLTDGTQLEIVGDDQENDGRTWRHVKDPSDGAGGWVAAEFVAAADAPPAAPKPVAPVTQPAPAAPAAERPTVAPAPKPAAPAAAKPQAPAVTGNAAAGVAPSSTTSCPASHPVKGNQGSRSNVDWIYHVPGSRSYNATQPERCFASAADAAAAGYRAPQQ